MLLPRYSLKMLMVFVTVASLLSVVFAMAYQGKPWAIAVSVAIKALFAAPTVYAFAYAAASLCLLLLKGARPVQRAGSPFQKTAAAPAAPAQHAESPFGSPPVAPPSTPPEELD